MNLFQLVKAFHCLLTIRKRISRLPPDRSEVLSSPSGCPRAFYRRVPHEFEVCALEGISSLSKMDATEKMLLPPRIRKKSSLSDRPTNRCGKSSEKATANGFAVGDREPSAVNVCASPGSCPQTADIVCKCAWLCSVIACHHFTLLIALSARAGAPSTCEGAEHGSNCARDSRSRHCRMLCPWREPPASSLRRFCLYLSSANVSSSDAALLKMMSLADSAVWSASSSLMNKSSAKPLHDPSPSAL